MGFSADLYTAVNSSMYKYFAIIGGIYQISSIVAAFILLYLLRGRQPAFRWTALGAAGLALAFVTWLVVVAPVNGEIEKAWLTSPETVDSLWMQLRPRWEYGHAAGFVLQLLGFSALAISILVDTPGMGRVSRPSPHMAALRQ